MTQRGKTTVRGHALQFEGRACFPSAIPIVTLLRTTARVSGSTHYRLTHQSEGTAYCECGAVSPTLPSTAARQRWHRDVHKPAVRARRDD